MSRAGCSSLLRFSGAGSLLLLWFLAAAQAQNDALATVEGKLVGSGPKPVVRLERIPLDPLAQINGYLGTVQPDGSFRFAGIPAGSYKLAADTQTQQHGEYGSTQLGRPGTVLRIHKGEHLRDVSLRLFEDSPGICGQVFNADGKPANTSVEVYTVTGSGYGSLAELREPPQLTGQDGFFQFPSLFDQTRYLLRANGFWYSPSGNFSDAYLLTPARHSSAACVQIHLPRVRCTGHTITGRIDGSLKGPITRYVASLMEVNKDGVLFEAQHLPLFREDQMVFDNACDGAYLLQVRNAWMDPVQMFASAVFAMKNGHLDNSVGEVHLHEIQWGETAKLVVDSFTKQDPALLSGTVKLEGLTWEQACPSHVNQQLGLLHLGDRNSVFAVSGKQGVFRFKDLSPGTYRLSLGEFTHGKSYLKEFRVNGEPADPRDFKLLPGQTASFEAIVSNNPAGATGSMAAVPLTPPHYLPSDTYPPASLSGLLVGPINASTTVALQSLRPSPPNSALYRTKPSSDGSFHFELVVPGLYRLVAQSDGMPPSAFGAQRLGLEGTAVKLMANEHRTGVKLPAPQPSTVCGTVTNLEGRPIAGVGVSVWESRFPVNSSNRPPEVSTDDSGRFELSLGSLGSYATFTVKLSGRTAYYELRHENSSFLEGEEKACPYTIQLRSDDETQPIFGRHVTGAIVGAPNLLPREHLLVKLTPITSVWAPFIFSADAKTDSAKTTFDVRGVPPGHYKLEVIDNLGDRMMICSGGPCYGDTVRVRAESSIVVGQTDLTDLSINLSALGSIDGKMLIDGKEPQEMGSLSWKDWGTAFTNMVVPTRPLDVKPDPSGHFSISGIPEGSYEISFARYWSQHAYVKDILLDGNPIEDNRLKLNAGQTAHLVIEVATRMAAGTVHAVPTLPPADLYKDLCGTSFSGSWGGIFLIPDPLPPDSTETLYANDGQFIRVPPGRYRVVAAENMDLSDLGGPFGIRIYPNFVLNHQFVSRLAAIGKTIDFAPGPRFDLEVPLATEQVQQILADLGIPITHAGN